LDRSLLHTALAAADAAAAVQQRWIGRVGAAHVSEKAARDFVSQADVESQQAAVEMIRARHPDHAVLAEEGDAGPGPTRAARGGEAWGGTRPGDAPLWVIDPVDGTTNFLHGHPMYAVSIAVVERGEPAVGVVHAPATGERWWASRGAGAFKNGRPIRVSSTPSLRTALVGTGHPFKAIHLLDRYLGQLGRVIQGSAGVRRGGAAALDLAYVASGIFDAFWELDLFPWDYMAGVLLIREAGGVISRMDGSPVGLEPGSILAGASPALAAELAAVLAG
jgi:myo-inositol-1(or 4)-monophosphatase